MMKPVEQAFDVAPLPPFATVESAIREAMPSLRPLARLRVSEVATRRMVSDGGHWVKWRPDVAPYMTEPMDATQSRRFDSVAFAGPSRCSKSEALVINPLVEAILENPRVVAVFSPSVNAAKEWSIGALDDLIRNSPELSTRLMSGKGGDTIFGKRFRGGCRLTVDYPVKDKLAQRSISLVIGTDYDAFPEDVGGDGSAFPLMRKRTEQAGTRGMAVIESSPRFPVLDETWSPETPHEAPPCDGILGIYNAGSRGRLYWTCPHCLEAFEPRFERLKYPDTGSPSERGNAAYMECPHNGCVIDARYKSDLNMSAYWLHEEADGSLVRLADLVRETPTASYWLQGPAAALAPWSRIVSRLIMAEETFAKTGDEGALKGVTNTELGLPYLPRAMASSEALNERALKAAAVDAPWKVCPPGTAFVTAAVDVQNGRFVVQVEAWRAGLARTVIDRFDIFTPPEGAPGAGSRRLDPGRYGEDWAALLPLSELVYPVAGSEYGLALVGVVIDGNGEPGVTANAYGFWRSAKRTHRNLFHVAKGRDGDNAKRAEAKRPETAHRGKAYVARDVTIIWAASDRLKDEISASLTRAADGARKLEISSGAPDQLFAEYAAERREAKGWRKRPGVQRNEALDLSVYALALVIVLEGEAVNWDNPPRWCLTGPGNAMARALSAPMIDAASGDDPAPEPVAAPVVAPVRSGWTVKKSKRAW